MYSKCVYWIFDLLSCPSDWSWNTWFWMIQNDVNNRVQCINVDSIIKPSLVTLISVTTKFYLIGLFYVISRPDIGNQYDCWTRLFFYPNSNRIERYLSLILRNEYSNTRFYICILNASIGFLTSCRVHQIDHEIPDFGWYKMTWIIGSSASMLIQS